jgi:hypothetical protein
MTFLASNHILRKSGTTGFELTLENKTMMMAARFGPKLAHRLLADLANRLGMAVHPEDACCCKHCPWDNNHAT